MAFQPTPNGIKIEMNATQNGVPVVNVFHVKAPGAVSTADLDDALAVFHTWWGTIKDGFHPSYVLNNFTATDISVEDGVQTILPETTGNVGTGTGAAAGGNVAIVASFRTGFTGRSFRGRSYRGGVLNGTLESAQNISVGAASGIAAQYVNLINALTTANLTLCVLSRYANKVLRVAGLLTEIIEVLVDTKIDSQRRRTAN